MELDRVFLDKASSKNIQRPQLEALMKYVRDDMVVCHSMDRRGRNLVDLRKTVGELTVGNFRLTTRLLTEIERVLSVNDLHLVSDAVVEAVRDSLMIGPASGHTTPNNSEKYAK